MLRAAPSVLGIGRRELSLLPHALARHAAGPRAGEHAAHERRAAARAAAGEGLTEQPGTARGYWVPIQSAMRRLIWSRTRRNTSSRCASFPVACEGSSKLQCKRLDFVGNTGHASFAASHTVIT